MNKSIKPLVAFISIAVVGASLSLVHNVHTEKRGEFLKEAEYRVLIDRTAAMQLSSAVLIYKERYGEDSLVSYDSDEVFNKLVFEKLVHEETRSALDYNFEFYGKGVTHVGYEVKDRGICSLFNEGKDIVVSKTGSLDAYNVTVDKNGSQVNFMSCVEVDKRQTKYFAKYKIKGTKVGAMWN